MSGSRCEVFISGAGVVSPLGLGCAAHRAALEAGRGGIGWIRHFPSEGFPVRIAGEVPAAGLPPGPGRLHYFAALALAEALEQAGLPAPDDGNDPARAVVWAVGKPVLPVPELAAWVAAAPQAGPGGGELAGELRRRYADRLRRQQLTPADLLARLARAGHAGGRRVACYTACASGNDALGMGKRMIERGEAQVVLAGGADSQVDALSLLEFELLAALAHPQPGEEPAEVCRPFDRRRTGFVVGEGAAALVLESGDHLRRRGGQPVARLAGYGSSLDAFGLTKCHPDGRGAAAAMTAALADAGEPTTAVDYINAHGTGTVLNDRAEAAAIHQVFGAEAGCVPVSSTKAMTGHLIAAASAVEAVLSVLGLEDGFIPPSLNYQTPDPECALNIVTAGGRRGPLRLALSNGFGFGGQNACVVLARA
ncbi:MAG: beta-ketoacyl-[acyl-carrier-protein] synthase family protein [Terriglobales bacterium]